MLKPAVRGVTEWNSALTHFSGKLSPANCPFHSRGRMTMSPSTIRNALTARTTRVCSVVRPRKKLSFFHQWMVERLNMTRNPSPPTTMRAMTTPRKKASCRMRMRFSG